MLVKTITCTNNSGDSITFADNRHFRLLNGFDLSALSATINSSDSTKNGSIYQSTKLENGDFDIEFYIARNGESDEWIEGKRHEINKILNPLKNPIRIDFETKGGKEYYIEAELTSTASLPQGFENSNKKWQKGLLQFIACDPFIYEKEAIKTDIAVWMGNLEFPLEIVEGGIEVGYRSEEIVVNVINNGSDDTGMAITLRATSEVVNPKLVNTMTYEELKLNITMQAGDVIEISTYTGNRYAILTRNSVQSNIFGTITLDSTFLQLRVGDNLLSYNADFGMDFLEVSITHRNTLIGV